MAEESVKLYTAGVKAANVRLASASVAGIDLAAHDMDVIQILFDLVYEGANGNGDRFNEEELRSRYLTLVNKPIDVEHYEPYIGTITKAMLVEPSMDEPLHISCEATIWAWRYPEYASDIIESAHIGEMGYGGASGLGLSMEVYFRDCNYVVGDYEQVIPSSEDDGTYEMLRGRYIGGKLVSRELLDITFGGAAVTEDPAEYRARLLAVASNTAKSGKELFSGVSTSDFALASSRMFPIDTADHTKASVQCFGKVASKFSDIPELLEAKARLRDAAAKYSLDASPLDEDYSSKESEAKDMTIEKDVTAKSTETPEATAGSTSIEATESAEASEASETAAVDTEADTAASSSEGTEGTEKTKEATVEDTSASGDAATQGTLPENPLDGLSAIVDRLQALIPDQGVASSSEDPEALAALRGDLEKANRSLLGLQRLLIMENPGFDAEASSDRVSMLASFTEEQFSAYRADISAAQASAAKANAEEDASEASEEGEIGSTTASLEAGSAKSDVYRRIWNNK